MQGQLAALLILAAGPLPAASRAASSGSGSNCNGKGVCTSWSFVLGAEHRENNNGFDLSSCKFGHTSVDAYPHECKPPCQGVTEYECACVSKEDAVAGLERKAAVLTWLGVGFMCGSPVLGAFIGMWHKICCKCQKNKCLMFWIYLWPFVLFFVGIILLIIGQVGIDTDGYWNGCSRE
mmetsp:Transcript_82494/g.191659  ORF Transcript_82494/g.191659 Transcript_82494/m.191659 type:complete len:178 (-) Transcript_82494:67-600(-)